MPAREVYPFTFARPYEKPEPGDFRANPVPVDTPEYNPKKASSALVYAEYSDLVPDAQTDSPARESAEKATQMTVTIPPPPAAVNQISLDDL